MTDNKKLRGAHDRDRVSTSEPYEVDYFAKKHNISAERARAIIKEAGNDRAKADKLASKS